MNIYRRKIIWKLTLLLMAVFIGVSSLLYTSSLVDQLKEEEREKVEHWAEAIQLVEISNQDEVLNLLSSIIEANNTVPVILCDENEVIRGHRNFDPVKSSDVTYMKEQLQRLKSRMDPIVISFGENMKSYIYYSESTILKKLRFYPFIQLLIIVFFISLAYYGFSVSRKAEQNQVWVGMSKETAHQLGTPTSSLAAWVEIIKEKLPESDLHLELGKDVERLEKITERFSKIGSIPELYSTNIVEIITHSVEYLKSRSGSRIIFETNYHKQSNIVVALNVSLFEWVMENLFKNAIDAMNGIGTIKVDVRDNPLSVIIDVSDTGKGITKSAFKNIFKPGYSTKERGWGLGLSLSKRIIEFYHHGKIFVRSSEPGKGSCIRIILNKEAR